MRAPSCTSAATRRTDDLHPKTGAHSSSRDNKTDMVKAHRALQGAMYFGSNVDAVKVLQWNMVQDGENESRSVIEEVDRAYIILDTLIDERSRIMTGRRHPSGMEIRNASRKRRAFDDHD
jgi:hypothetical protein